LTGNAHPGAETEDDAVTVPTEKTMERLRAGFDGAVIVPGEAEYDEARKLFNGMIDRRPAAFAQCANVADVQRALRFGREAGLEIAVRGGGHGVAGRALSEGGLVIDLRRMNAVTVDPEARTARVAGGATMSHLDRATEKHGLAAAGGRVSTTGVGGYILGGGDGWMARHLGLACDNLVAVELVTAAGDVVHASEKENPELFWALHGGGGNFGVATAFTVRLHPMSNVNLALLFWPAARGEKIVQAYRDFMEGAPNEVGGAALFMTGPAEEFVPESMRGRLCCAVLLVHAGAEEDGRRVLAPMLALDHAGGFVNAMPYADMQCMLDDPPGYRNYWSAEYLGGLPDEAVAAFCTSAEAMIVPSPSQHPLFPQGGAIARGPAEFPIPWRGAPWAVHPFGLWADQSDDERGRAWAQGVRKAMRPWARGDVYLNFIGEGEGSDRVIAGWGKDKYTRLQRVKREYDPQNVFRSNHNIRPE
jgi:FAD/FMN-containing dehydrogenase